jgi:eukaryotic-like serine/threonine-protein kinase
MNYIGRYKLETKLGEGSFGIVYRAYDPIMDRSVAIKSIKVGTMNEEQIKHSLNEFHHEAKIAGKYTHENIVAIYDVINEGGLDYIVMEYIPGCSILDYMINIGPMDVEETLSVIYKCCIGLAYIHYHGIIHRDIKPGNIMYHPVNGIAKITDFSISQKIEEQPIRNCGTIAYMAPEHFDEKRKITTLTDLFALGSTMYRMLTKKYPFTKENTASQIMNESAIPVYELQPEVPEEVSSIIDKAMAKNDESRFQSAAEFAFEIKQTMDWLYPHSPLIDPSKEYVLM